jgi:hypothetical protein
MVSDEDVAMGVAQHPVLPDMLGLHGERQG